MLRVLTLSTLYPDATRPGFGGFVARQTERLAAHPDVDLRVISARPLPPRPFDAWTRYAALARLPEDDVWNGVQVLRPRATAFGGILPSLLPYAVVEAARHGLVRLAMQGWRPDVIDAEFLFPDGVAAAEISRRSGVPFLVKARGSDVEYWGRRTDTGGQIRAACAATGKVLAVSGALAATMRDLGMGEATPHYTGVDLDRFRPMDRAAAKARWGIDGPLVVSVGNLVPLKGHDIVMEAVARLDGVAALIVGDGPERARLAARGSDRVRVVGPVAHDDMPTLLAAADVLALASEREGLANVWVEALACGTPVVAPDIGSAREVVDRPAAGRMVARTPEAFAEAIAALIAAPPDPDATRAAALRFSWQRNTDNLFAHLTAVASRRA